MQAPQALLSEAALHVARVETLAHCRVPRGLQGSKAGGSEIGSRPSPLGRSVDGIVAQLYMRCENCSMTCLVAQSAQRLLLEAAAYH